MRRIVTLTALLAGAAPALAQSLNIDINRNAAGFTAPTAAFGGAASQPGTWNMVNGGSSGSQSLLGLNGASSGCTVTKNGNTGSSTTFPGTGDWASLMEDFDYTIAMQSNLSYTINGLDQGLYFVVVYMASLGDSAYWIDNFGYENYYTNSVSVYVGGSNVAADYGSTSGPVTPNVFQAGVTHTTLVVPVGAGAPAVEIRAHTGATNHERVAINGVQLVKVETNRLYVNKNVATSGLGLTWGSAIRELSTALSIAAESGGAITEIWVAAGEYYPQNSVNRFATFTIPSGVKVYGGFAGNETQLSQRNIDAYPTILSGDPAQTPTLGDNCYHVVTVTNANSNTRLDGFEIREGQATGAAARDKDGAAMYIDGSSIRVFNCRFDICQAESEGGHCYLTNNSAPAFVNCSFYNGYAVQFGGSIRNTTDSRFSAWNCFFGFCGADINGGAINSTSEIVSLYNCVFSNNFCGSNGGAVYIFGSTASSTVVCCTFAYNSAGDFDTTGSLGGLGAASSAQLTVRNSIFYGNTDNNGATSTEAGNLGLQTGATFAALQHCLVQGWTGTYGGTGNFTGNPLFVDPNGADNQLGTRDDHYALATGSPCIDQGTNSGLPLDTFDLDGDGVTILEGLPVDYEGNDRWVDAVGVPNSPAGWVDVGAYEFQNIRLGDMNCDGNIDFFDIDPFLLAQFDPAGYAAAFPNCNRMNGDMNSDGSVDFFDIDPFVACVFGACP